jgi:hypothetical protein
MPYSLAFGFAPLEIIVDNERFVEPPRDPDEDASLSLSLL